MGESVLFLRSTYLLLEPVEGLSALALGIGDLADDIDQSIHVFSKLELLLGELLLFKLARLRKLCERSLGLGLGLEEEFNGLFDVHGNL